MQKAVAGATKPKNGSAPKAKYVDPIVASTFTADGTFHEACRAIAARLRDPNSTVVFKALIIVHTLVRAGKQETVLGYLSGTKMLGLETIVGGYDTAQNLSKYANYLDRRIRTYGAIKYDIIRDKSERRAERDGIKGCNRLRHLSVDKGLLRETTLLQKEMDSLAECKFYLDDLDDDVTMTALRLLVKDLLLLFQAVNEGVINVLEHYFEMSHNDAATALKIYKRFCTQMENVVGYLGVAKKMQNIINVPIPNLRHAPVSLQKSLEEYLNNPNFEANREEYKRNKRIADGLPVDSKAEFATTTTKAAESTPKQEPAKANHVTSFQDFFSSIESEQASMFNPQTNSPTMAYFQQQAAANPFLFGQPTGFQPMQVQPQPTGFNAIYGLTAQPTGYEIPIQPQMTGFASGGMLAPQPTGANPFRQSIAFPPTQQSFLQPQQTGMLAFSASQPNLSAYSNGQNAFPNAFPNAQPFPQAQQHAFLQPQATSNPFLSNSTSSMPQQAPTSSAAPFRQLSLSVPPSPAPHSNFATSNPPERSMTTSAAPIMAQPTGSRNPFAPVPGSIQAQPPKAAQPSLNMLAANAFARSQSTPPFVNQNQQSVASPPPQSQQQPLQSQATGGGGLFASIASSFTTNGTEASRSESPAPVSTLPPFSSSFAQRSSTMPLTSQPTGFAGSTVQPFKPSSSFGTSLAASLDAKTVQAPINNAPTGSFSSAFAPSSSGLAANGSTPNPFRASILPSTNGTSSSFANAFGNDFQPQSQQNLI